MTRPLSPTAEARRTALLAFLNGRGWTAWSAILVNLSTTGALRETRSPKSSLSGDLEALIKAGEVEREAVVGIRDGLGRAVWSYRRVRK